MAQCVLSSPTLPLWLVKYTGTPPSQLTVRVYNSCFRSGRWSLLYCNVISNPEHEPLVKRLHAMLEDEFGPRPSAVPGKTKAPQPD
jgi:hypothetical protein